MSRLRLWVPMLFLPVVVSLAGGCKEKNGQPSDEEPGADEPPQFEDPDRSKDVPPEDAGLVDAPPLENVTMEVNRDNALVVIPPVPGAKDYRAFRLPPGVTVETLADGGERVSGTTIYCAGQRQRNSAATAEPEVLQTVQVNDIDVATTIVIEAIDALCPFVGVVGHAHSDMQATAPQLAPEDRVPFAVYTEDEVRSRYGSMYVNGQGPGSALAAQAEPFAPRVLSRSVVEIVPLGTGSTPTQAFFDDFTDAVLPQLVGELPSYNRTVGGKMYQTPSWTFFSYGAGYSEFAIERGQLHMIVADYNQNVIASNLAMPRRTAQLSDAAYLHVTYEVPSNATDRRYWWLSLCGNAAGGQTLDSNGVTQSPIVLAPFFYTQNGLNPSVSNWNCLQVFPRDGMPFPLGPDGTRPESDIRVMVNVPDKAAESVINVSPAQYPSLLTTLPPSWYRQRDGAGALVGPMLDDQLQTAVRTRFDVYVRRDRVVVFVGGEQRLCNDFPGQRLTMGEAALAFGQVLFDSADERRERMFMSNLRTGQRYYTANTPYIDVRSWDNVGFDENVAEPTGFDASRCYAHP